MDPREEGADDEARLARLFDEYLAGEDEDRDLETKLLARAGALRERLAETLRWIVSQRLAPKEGGGRIMIPEIMGSNLRSRETIQLGEGDVRNYADIIEQAKPDGWCTFEQSLTERYQEGVITEETAMLLSVNKRRMRQKLDIVKKVLGRDDATTENLKLSPTDEHLPKMITTDISKVAPTTVPLPSNVVDMKLRK